MARIFYGVSPIGLGHASRAVAVGERLAAKGDDVVFASGGPALDSIRGSGLKALDVIAEPAPNVRGGEMKGATAWYFAYWRGFRRSRRAVAGVLGDWKPGAVVGDEEFSCVSLALESGIPHALVTDELELGFARTWIARKVEGRVSRWYSDLQRSVSLLIIPETGEDGGNRRYVGPIVRPVRRDRSQVLRDLGIPPERRVVLVSMSGTGAGAHLVEGAKRAVSSIPDAVLVLAGNRGRKVTGERIFDLGVVRDGQDLVAAADVAVSTAGKSTIDEAASFGTPLVAIPIRNHSEQARNAAALGFSADDLARLPELVASRIGKRVEPADYRGAEKAAQLVHALAG